MDVELVATPEVLEHVRSRGGAVYVWPLRASCCGGTIELRAATERPAKVFRQVEASGVELFLTVGMIEPDSLHLEVSRRGTVRAFWNGLAWVA